MKHTLQQILAAGLLSMGAVEIESRTSKVRTFQKRMTNGNLHTMFLGRSGSFRRTLCGTNFTESRPVSKLTYDFVYQAGVIALEASLFAGLED